jgi:phosphomannomutase
MITASHNPPEDNGFKIALKNRPLIGDDFFKILNVPLKERGMQGKCQSLDIVEDYITNMKKSLPSSIFEREDVVWDTGHGVAGPLIRKLFAKATILYENVDGRFPAHSPDPAKEENVKDLQREVVSQRANVGIGIDADGDRLGVVDKDGRLIPIELVSSLFAAEILKKHKNATIIGDIKSSRFFQESVEKNGGKFVLCKTGHSYIKNKMKETKALFAGEASGHLFFADSYPGFDDAIYASLRLLALDYDLKKLVNPYIFYDTQFGCTDQEKFLIVERIKEELTQEKRLFCDLDGVRIDTKSGWWLVRASNTQSLLICRCEANNQNNLDALIADMVHYLKKGGVL